MTAKGADLSKASSFQGSPKKGGNQFVPVSTSFWCMQISFTSFKLEAALKHSLRLEVTEELSPKIYRFSCKTLAAIANSGSRLPMEVTIRCFRLLLRFLPKPRIPDLPFMLGLLLLLGIFLKLQATIYKGQLVGRGWG